MLFSYVYEVEVFSNYSIYFQINGLKENPSREKKSFFKLFRTLPLTLGYQYRSIIFCQGIGVPYYVLSFEHTQCLPFPSVIVPPTFPFSPSFHPSRCRRTVNLLNSFLYTRELLVQPVTDTRQLREKSRRRDFDWLSH